MKAYEFNQHLNAIKSDIKHQVLTPSQGYNALLELQNQFAPNTVFYDRIEAMVVKPEMPIDGIWIGENDGQYHMPTPNQQYRSLDSADMFDILDSLRY